MKIVLFDFDGVIVDTFAFCYRIIQARDGISEDEYRARFEGNINTAASKKVPADPSAKPFDFFAQYTPALMACQPVAGIKEVILELAQQYVLIIISSTISPPIAAFLELHGLRSAFTEILGNDVEKSKVKKIQMVLERYTIQPSETVLITDTLGDIKEAKECGVESIAVTWGYHPKKTLQQGAPRELVDEPKKILEFIQRSERERAHIQSLISSRITHFSLKGRGACNDAYYLERETGDTLIVKQERAVKEFQPQNSLLVEARVAQRLFQQGFSLPIPEVVLISEQPALYAYRYLEGEPMKEVWATLSEDRRITICEKIGVFQAKIGQKMSKEDARALGVKIDESSGLHPEVSQEYVDLLAAEDVPLSFKELAKQAKELFEGTHDQVVFQFLHNDAHHENFLIKDGAISGVIDFGNAEYGEVAKEFSRWIRDYPEYFPFIVTAYEKASGHTLSYQRLVSNAFLSGFMEIMEDYRKGGENRVNAERSIAVYKKLLN